LFIDVVGPIRDEMDDFCAGRARDLVGCDAEGLIGGVGRILGEDRDRHLVGRSRRAREKDQRRYHQASHCRLRRYSHNIFLR
jgi:hypothetical protein